MVFKVSALGVKLNTISELRMIRIASYVYVKVNLDCLKTNEFNNLHKYRIYTCLSWLCVIVMFANLEWLVTLNSLGFRQVIAQYQSLL